MFYTKYFRGIVFLSVFSLSACMQNFNTSSLMKNNQINVDKNTNGVVALKEVFDSSVEKIPTLTAVGDMQLYQVNLEERKLKKDLWQ